MANMHKRASTQIKSPGYFLQKLISVNPSIDFSRQFGIGRYFYTICSPQQKKMSLLIAWEIEKHTLLGDYSQEGLMVFLLPKCVEIKTILRELLLIIVWIIMQEFHVLLPICNRKLHSSTLSSSTRPKNAFIRFEYFILFPTTFFPKHVCINFPSRLNGMQKVCMISI